MTESIETRMNEMIIQVVCVDELLDQTMKKYSEGKLEYGDENFSAYLKEMKELKKKW